jgi:ABC-type bacteriocin/lantibiotic exporter with double-glycine peptidase domain
VRAWILYSGLRVGVFLVIFVLNPAWAISAVAAAVLALCISYIFFRPLRERVARDVVAARAGTVNVTTAKAGSDEDVEDTARGD